jgi:YggT family protein
MQNALIFLVKSLADLYLLTFLMRFVMQWVRAGYHNPLAQFIFKVTNPLVVPARRVLPSVGGLDAPTLVVLILLEIVVTFVLLRLASVSLPVPVLLFYSLLRLVALVLWFYFGATLVYVLLSWFGDRGRNPIGSFLGELVEPLLRPARRLLPPTGGFDFSPLIVLLLLQAAMIALPLPPYLR